MLQPKRTKFRKMHKGRIKGEAKGGSTLTFGHYGLKALQPERVTARQIEAARRAMTRHMKRQGRVWIRIFPDTPVSSKPVEVRMGEAWARLEPADRLSIAFEIDFPDAAIGHQQLELELCNGTFVRELSDCRTFCRQADVDFMRENGLALGGTYENAVVVAGPDVLSPGGLRRANEPVRHKMLDAMGDLAVAGAPILGRYVGHRAGHTLTGRLVRALLADPQAWDWVTVDGEQAHSLPGAGVCAEDLAPAA